MIPYKIVVADKVRAVRQRTLGDYNMCDQFYAKRYDFGLKLVYYTLVGQHPFHGLLLENPMDNLERFEDLTSSIKCNEVSEDYFVL